MCPIFLHGLSDEHIDVPLALTLHKNPTAVGPHNYQTEAKQKGVCINLGSYLWVSLRTGALLFTVYLRGLVFGISHVVLENYIAMAQEAAAVRNKKVAVETWMFRKIGSPSCGFECKKSPLFGIYIRDPDCWKLTHVMTLLSHVAHIAAPLGVHLHWQQKCLGTHT